MSRLVQPEAIRQAADRLRGIVVRTPLLPAPWLEEAVGAEVRLKCENLQHIGAFKFRGAFTMLDRLSPEERGRGVITYSSGNHAQAVSLAARRFGVPAVVVMPTTAPAVKVEGARRYGAEVVFEGTTSIERRERAEAIAEERGLVVVPPFDHPDIIAGQGTAGLEILEDWPEARTFLVPVGGGGLLSGVAAWIRRQKPDATIIGVEPENADAMRRSLQAGEPVTIETPTTVADGLAPVRPGDLTFRHARDLVDRIVTVDDRAILDAARRLATEAKLVVEFSGAATVAALLDHRVTTRGEPTVVILSGGNVDPMRLASLLTGTSATTPE